LLICLLEFSVFIKEGINIILFGILDSEIDESLLFLNQLLVLDPIISRVDLANQVEPLLLLFLSDSTISYFNVEGLKLIFVGFMLGLAFVLIGIKGCWLPFLNRLFRDFANILLAH